MRQDIVAKSGSLDVPSAVTWWHRNVAKAGYGLQGWRRQKVYPNFIFAAAQDGGPNRIVVLETKGDHLAGNEDTRYKKAMMDVLTGAFEWDHTRPAGELELVAEDGTTVQCGLARKKWRAPTEEPGGVLWETGTDRRRSFGVKLCGWR
jgi:type III restriction enzyme